MPLRDHLGTAAYIAAGLVCVMMMQHHAALDADNAVSRGMPPRRRLAGSDNEYAGAMRNLFGEGGIWSLTSATSSNGIAGPAQLMITTVLILVLGSLAAGAGIGGGGLFVPIYMVLLGAGPKGAVPLSKATILGGAIGNFISIGPARHPKARRPMIDYESSTLMQSGELLGVVFGVLLNNLLPAICIVVFLVLILSYNSFKTIKKGIAVRKKETAAFEKEKKAAEEKAKAEAGDKEVEETPACPDPSNGSTESAPAPAPTSSTKEVKVEIKGEKTKAKAKEEKEEDPYAGMSEELKKIHIEDSKQYPVWAWALLVPMTAYTLGYSLVKNVIKNADGCSPAGYWIWYVTPVPILGGFMVFTAYILGKRHQRKLAAGFEYLAADMQWDNATLKRFPVTALLAGLTAGLLGIGGGMVIGPLFLAIGMEPQVGTSSCAFMILWTAFSGVVIYAVDNHLGAQLAIWYAHKPQQLSARTHSLALFIPLSRSPAFLLTKDSLTAPHFSQVRRLWLHLRPDRPAARQQDPEDHRPALVRRLSPWLHHRRRVLRDGDHARHQDGDGRLRRE